MRIPLSTGGDTVRYGWMNQKNLPDWSELVVLFSFAQLQYVWAVSLSPSARVIRFAGDRLRGFAADVYRALCAGQAQAGRVSFLPRSAPNGRATLSLGV